MAENLKKEKKGIDAVIKWEKSQGREAHRISSRLGKGCDMISKGNGETRYIEVKWEKTIGTTEYSTNVLNLGKGLANLYLYVVTQRGQGTLELRVISPELLLGKTQIVSKFSFAGSHIKAVTPEVIAEK